MKGTKVDWQKWIIWGLSVVVSIFIGRGTLPIPPLPTSPPTPPVSPPPAPPVMPPWPFPPFVPGYPVSPPSPLPPPAPPQIKTADAIARIRTGNSGCTGTIFATNTPGKYYLLTCRHCVRHEGQEMSIMTKTHGEFTGKVKWIHKSVDLAMSEFRAPEGLPHAYIATKRPEEGVEVWHMGYGVRRPGSYETGTILSLGRPGSDAKYRIDASSGDSGSGIFRKDTGELVGVLANSDSQGRTGGPSWFDIYEFAFDEKPPSAPSRPGG